MSDCAKGEADRAPPPGQMLLDDSRDARRLRSVGARTGGSRAHLGGDGHQQSEDPTGLDAAVFVRPNLGGAGSVAVAGHMGLPPSRDDIVTPSPAG